MEVYNEFAVNFSKFLKLTIYLLLHCQINTFTMLASMSFKLNASLKCTLINKVINKYNLSAKMQSEMNDRKRIDEINNTDV